MGHGKEKVIEFGERTTLPPGYTLVTLVEHGTISSMKEVCKTLQLFSEPEYQDLLANPRENKAKLEAMLGKTIHVYTEGFKIPSLEVLPLADWNGGRYLTTYKKFIRSGLYRFPIPPSERTQFHSNNLNFSSVVLRDFPEQNEEIAKCFPYLYYTKKHPNLTEELLPLLYEHSLYPTIEQARTKLGSSFETIKQHFQIPALDLMLRQGPGVYYYVICRDVSVLMAGYHSFFDIALNLEEEELAEIPEALQPKYRSELMQLKEECDALEHDIFLQINAFITGLGKLSDDVFAAAFYSFTGKRITKAALLDQFPKYREYVATTTRIRTNSHRQQQGHGRSARRHKGRRRRTIRRR